MTTAIPYRAESPSDAESSVTTSRRVILPEMPPDARKIRQHIERAWKAYRGDWKDQMPLKVERGDPDDNVLVNRCAPIVDKGVSFLFGEAPKIEVKDKTGKRDGPKAAQDALDAALGDEDDFMTTFTMLAMNGGVAGHTFAKLLPTKAGNAKGEASYPRIVVQDPSNYWVVTDPDDVNCPLQYVCEYECDMPGGRKVTKRVVTEREDEDAPWTICTYERERLAVADAFASSNITSNAEGSWLLIDEEEWPYPWSPIHDCMNLPNPNEYWGVPDLTPDLIHLNSVLNYVASNINKLGRMQSGPLAWAAGVDAREVVVGPGRIVCFPSAETKIGSVQWAGDLASLMAFEGVIREDMEEQSRFPAIAMGRQESMPRGNVSGVALKVQYQPPIEKTTTKRRLYGKLIRSLGEHILEMLGFPGLKVKIHWPNILPADDLAEAQTAQIKQQVGISKPTLLREMGYDPDAEAENNADEAKKQLDMYAKGQGMPPAGGQQQPPGQPGQQQQQQGGPPQNAPAAIAQRNAVRALAQAGKAGGGR
jgi:hypothetical protein